MRQGMNFCRRRSAGQARSSNRSNRYASAGPPSTSYLFRPTPPNSSASQARNSRGNAAVGWIAWPTSRAYSIGRFSRGFFRDALARARGSSPRSWRPWSLSWASVPVARVSSRRLRNGMTRAPSKRCHRCIRSRRIGPSYRSVRRGGLRRNQTFPLRATRTCCSLQRGVRPLCRPWRGRPRPRPSSRAGTTRQRLPSPDVTRSR
jgi:hypothetical protein